MQEKYKDYPYWVIIRKNLTILCCITPTKRKPVSFTSMQFYGTIHHISDNGLGWYIEKYVTYKANEQVQITATPDLHKFYCFKTYEEAEMEYILYTL